MSMSPATSTNLQSTRAKPQPKNPKLTTNNNTIITATSSPATNAEEKPQPASPKRRRRKTRSRSKTPELEKTNVTDSYPSPPSSPAQNRTAAKSATTPPASPSKPRKAKKQTSAPAAGAQAVVSGEGATTGLGQRTVVDDVSEFGDEKESPVYNEARDFMSKYLASPPPPGNNGSALLLCQALIIELGLNSTKPSSNASKPATASYFSNPNLPRSLTQAKALLKSQAFISIRDYLDEREHGPVALRNAMHGSRKSLVKDIRRTPNKRTPLKWVKQTGLNVLLVNTRA
ncbi:uncharacterized protein STEHIDRAFT_154228 [Stereum hirsutum FP-91666 SS1]|uniref:uncharacterized protein n=1 Tax=Stereum hirsutum (strain FP-91666) TaxID=721885 RepID=UPI000440E907|nr:uncharacterized protein STEHIDRAFT_154228 [Stereum hirsutum FP-91666 SS1]EIM90404.1 hypothetical protein STEHIDRAFT_154228 [Stereum hirsutum FP-91666 SS1]